MVAGCPSSHQPTRIREETLESGGPLQRKLNFRLRTHCVPIVIWICHQCIIHIIVQHPRPQHHKTSTPTSQDIDPNITIHRPQHHNTSTPTSQDIDPNITRHRPQHHKTSTPTSQDIDPNIARHRPQHRKTSTPTSQDIDPNITRHKASLLAWSDGGQKTFSYTSIIVSP